MRARSATVGDLETVFCDLSKRMVAEYIAAGKDAKLAYDDLMMNMKEGRAHALVQGDDVVAIISWRESDDATITLFAAKDEFSARKRCASARSTSARFKHFPAICPFIHESGWTGRKLSVGSRSSVITKTEMKTARSFMNCRQRQMPEPDRTDPCFRN